MPGAVPLGAASARRPRFFNLRTGAALLPRMRPVSVDCSMSRLADANMARVLLSSSRPIIGMNERWTTLTRQRPLVEHGWPSGARVSRYPTAGSHHSYGVDSTTRRFCANGIMKVFFNDCQASNQYDAAVTG